MNLIGLSYMFLPLSSLMGSHSLLKTLACIFASDTSLIATKRRALREAMVGDGASGLGSEQRLSQLRLYECVPKREHMMLQLESLPLLPELRTNSASAMGTANTPLARWVKR